MQDATNNSGTSAAPIGSSTPEPGLSPSYATLFPEKFRGICSTTAPESNEGPIAYLWDLYNQAIALEAKGERNASVSLGTRRPDLGKLVIGPEAAKIRSSLTVVVDILQNLAQEHVGSNLDLTKVLATARQPLPLPFNHSLELSNEVLKLKKLSLIDLIEQSDLDYPSFTSAQLRTARMRMAMLCNGVLEPERRSILVEPFSTTKENPDSDSGMKPDAQDATKDLTDVGTFIQRTGLEAADIYDLLGVTNFNPRETSTVSAAASKYIVADHAGNKSAMMPYPYGAGFINQSTTSMVALTGNSEIWGTSLQFAGATAKHFFRMNKILHLKKCFDIDYDSVDLLILSALNAEGHTAELEITENTIRALGVYRYFNEKFAISAEQFSALIGPIPCHTKCQKHTLLDKLFGGAITHDNASTDVGIKLDGTVFHLEIDASDAPTQSAYKGLCQALTVDAATLQALLTLVCQAQQLSQPVLSISVLSALYRLTVLAKILGSNPLEGLKLLMELGKNNSQIFEQLAGAPQINDNPGGDVLDVLTTLASLANWVKKENVEASALRYWLAEQSDSLLPLNALKKLIVEVGPKIPATLLTEARIQQELKNYNFAFAKEIENWLPMLATVVDSDGCVVNVQTNNVADITQLILPALKDARQGTQDKNTDETCAQIAEALHALIQNAHTAQMDMIGKLVGFLPGAQPPLGSQHPELLIRWAKDQSVDYLKEILSASLSPLVADASPASITESLSRKWCELCRLANIAQHLNLSALGLKTLLDHPQWLSSKNREKKISLGSLYELSLYRDLVSVSRSNGVKEAALLDVLYRAHDADAEKNIKSIINDICTIISSEPSAVEAAWSSIYKKRSTPKAPNFQDFFSRSSAAIPERWKTDRYRSQKALGAYYEYYDCENIEGYNPSNPYENQLCKEFAEYLRKNPGTLNVTPAEKKICGPRSAFAYLSPTRPTPAPEIFLSETLLDDGTPADKGESLPQTIYDITLLIRIFSLQQRTGLPSESLLSLGSAEKMTENLSRYASSTLSTCDEIEQGSITDHLQILRRDALLAYLLSYWAPVDKGARTIGVVDKDTLSNYLLTDVLVSPSVQSTLIKTATASLQYYLHRLFAYLEPGYTNKRAVSATLEWNMFRKEYSLWRTRQRQLNHPENLIVPSARPGKTAAFKELENELSQSRLTTDTVQSAVVNYLSKFEKISNLQFISGYLDGIDPSNDTYHFVGRTNVAPAQYFWRQLDMSMRDSRQRLSPMAWSEWEKIDVPVSGKMTNVLVDKGAETDIKANVCSVNIDLIRPVIICGRRYVFWVEDVDESDMKKDEKKTTKTMLEVFYSFLQIDGQWSPANKVLTEKVYKDPGLSPYLIVVVDESNQRKSNPCLVILLGGINTGESNVHYRMEVRDLLLMDKTQIPAGNSKETLFKTLDTNLKDPLLIQRPLRDKATLVTPLTKGRLVLNDEIEKTNQLASEPFALTPLEKLIKTVLIRQGADTCRVENYRDALAFLMAPEGSHDKIYLLIKSTLFKDDESAIAQARLSFRDLLAADSGETQVPAYLWDQLEEDGYWPLVPWSNSPSDDGDGLIIFENAGTRRLRRVAEQPNGLECTAVRSALPYQIELISDYADSDGKGEIRAVYPRMLFDPDKPVLKDLEYTHTFTLNNKQHSITCNTLQMKTAKVDDTLDVEWRISPALDADTKISYYVENTFHSATLERQKNPSLHTAKLSISIKQLVQDEVSLIVHDLEKPDANLYELRSLFRTTIRPLIDSAALKNIQLALYVKAPSSAQPQKLTEETVLADGAAIITHTYTLSEAGAYYFTLLETGNPNLNGYQAYDVTKSDSDTLWSTQILRNSEHVQYLKFDNKAPNIKKVPFDQIRLNTLFGKNLVAQASKSVHDVLQWRTQQINEPAIAVENDPAPLDFHGASGRYFREIFLHLPELVSTRFSDEKRFKEAQAWCTRYLFDPFRTLATKDGKPPYWNARPLVKVGSGASLLTVKVDPAGLAFSSARAHREAVFLLMVENWLKEGDHLYRQLTSDSLTQAWLCYQQAQNLIGTLPNITTSTSWVAVELSRIERRVFRRPPNDRLLDMHTTLSRRFFTLRHGLTINGSVTPFDPQQLGDFTPSRGVGSTSGVASNFNSNRASIPPYRFLVMYRRAQDAVTQLINMGHKLMALMETQADTNLAALQLSHQVQLSDFTLQLQKEALRSAESGKQTLAVSLEAAEYRQNFYSGLLNEYKSTWESAAIAFSALASIQELASTAFVVAEAPVEMIPNIFGMAFGGQRLGAPLRAVLEVTKSASLANTYIADRLCLEGEYARRAEEWGVLVQEAYYETRVIKQQMAEQQILINAAKIGIEESKAVTSTLKEAYTAMTTGFTILPTYNWMVARLSDLYSPAYDATLALCVATEAAYRYEMGDYRRRRFITPTAWDDTYLGMLAGESLQKDLQEMQTEFTQKSQRGLSIKKTISLKEYLNITDAARWLTQLKALESKPIAFSLRASDFDSDYPGHYMRKVLHVSVSFVTEKPELLRNMCATLVQTSNLTLVEPDLAGVKLLYEPDKSTPVSSVVSNVRSQQQIALSTLINHDGRGVSGENWLCTLVFDDGRYLPFEGTGAISNWSFSIPNPKSAKSLYDGSVPLISDIQINLVYTALDGGAQFASDVQKLKT